ncbi:MAG: hypothetical protein GY696_17110 [Gammaproteobacteria bacterium]|nr:hypothetical protein [Gammaproteobacteria bacterium]
MLDPTERPLNVPVFEHTPTLDYLCAQMRNLDDSVMFPGSKSVVIPGSAVEQPKGITLNEDCDVIPSDFMTMDVPQQSRKTMIQGVVNVPKLFSESGTGDDNVEFLDNEQRSIPKVGSEYTEYTTTDLARVRRRRPILRGSPTFPTGMTVLSALVTTVLCFSLLSAGFPLTEGQVFGVTLVPKFRSANRIPNYREVPYFCPRLSGGSIPRQTNCRKPHLWCDMNHCFCNVRQTSGRKSHLWRTMHFGVTGRLPAWILFLGKAMTAFCFPGWSVPRVDDQGPRNSSIIPVWSVLSGVETAYFSGEGRRQRPGLFHFGQSAERLLTGNGTTSGIGDWRWDGVDGSMVNQIIIQSINYSRACVTREEDKTERWNPQKTQVFVVFFIVLDYYRFSHSGILQEAILLLGSAPFRCLSWFHRGR